MEFYVPPTQIPANGRSIQLDVPLPLLGNELKTKNLKLKTQ